MTLRSLNNLARKNDVLRITIDEYIETVTPVSSARIVEKNLISVSSATIRNILAELERDGYLSHPHTSAGRVPTETGYRYYVDHFVNQIHLLEEEKARIRAAYMQESLELEALLDRTSRILSDTTHYTTIISLDGQGSKVFCGGTNFIVGYPDYQDINKNIIKIKSILSALDEKERLLEVINRDLAKKIDILIGHEIECSDMDSCSLVVSQYRSKKGPSGRIAVLGPTRMDYNKVVSTLEYFSNLIEEIL